MDNISPRPWKLCKTEDGYEFTDANNNWICDAFNDEDSEYILKCVNEHDSLVTEVERLKQENERLHGIDVQQKYKMINLESENKLLKEALKKV